MPSAIPPPGPAKPVNRHVQTNHRIRSSSFVMGFAIIAAHIVGKDYGPVTWGLLVLQFFVYPPLLYGWTRRSSHPLQTEYRNLLLDPFLLGIWCAALGFPLWITFVLLNCTLINISFYRDTRGAVQAIIAFFAGALLGVALTGLRFAPHTDWPATLLCVIGLTLYLLMATSAAYVRNCKLRDTRAQLLHSEQALQSANQALQQQIEEIHALQAQLSEQANRDPLTGLYNRRYLGTTLERELARCARAGQPLSLMLLDVDHFKQVNDTYGHQAGDEVLKKLAAMLTEQARTADVVCRFGGEEFLLLLPDMAPDIALARAEQWRSAFAATTVLFDEFQLQATLSIGIASYPSHGESPEELIRCADRALYRAKSEGRNRVVLWGAEAAVTRA